LFLAFSKSCAGGLVSKRCTISCAMDKIFCNSLGYFSLIFFNLPLKKANNGPSSVIIFIFYLGVLSPCLKIATTDRSSSLIYLDFTGLNRLEV